MQALRRLDQVPLDGPVSAQLPVVREWPQLEACHHPFVPHEPFVALPQLQTVRQVLLFFRR